MLIRAATVADVSELFDLRCSVRENHMSPDQLARVGITPVTVAEMISCGDYVVPVIESADHVVVAFAIAQVSRGYLSAVFVRPGFERRGYGTAVLARVEAALRERGVTRVWLATGSEESLRAHAFYRTQGWVAAGILPDGQTRYDKVLR